MFSNARFIPLMVYALLGVAIGIGMFILWRKYSSNTRHRVFEESFNVQNMDNDPPKAPCNLKFGSLVQDQVLEKNANQGNKNCSHYYSDPTILNGNIEIQPGPQKLLFCTADKSPASVSDCLGECPSGHCLSLQSEADTITADTTSVVNKFQKNLSAFEKKVFNNIQTTFDGPTVTGVVVQNTSPTNPSTKCPTANMKGVKNRIDYGLCRRGELKTYAQQVTEEIKAYDKAVPVIRKHVEAQQACMNVNNNGHLWYNVVASKTKPTEDANATFFQPQSTPTKPIMFPLGQPNSSYQCWTTGRSADVTVILKKLQKFDHQIKSIQQNIDDSQEELETYGGGSGSGSTEFFIAEKEQGSNEKANLQYKIHTLQTELKTTIAKRNALRRRLDELTRPPPSEEFEVEKLKGK